MKKVSIVIHSLTIATKCCICIVQRRCYTHISIKGHLYFDQVNKRTSSLRKLILINTTLSHMLT